jgi:hypothetical protein
MNAPARETSAPPQTRPARRAPYHRDVLERLLTWIRSLQPRPLTPDDLDAEREAKRVEDDLETTRVLGRSGPRAFTSDTEWKGE